LTTFQLPRLVSLAPNREVQPNFQVLGPGALISHHSVLLRRLVVSKVIDIIFYSILFHGFLLLSKGILSKLETIINESVDPQTDTPSKLAVSSLVKLLLKDF
jgi:hypothetical protein